MAEVMIVTRENNRIFINYAIAYTCKYNYNEWIYLCLHLILYITLPLILYITSLRLGSAPSALLHHSVLCHPLINKN